MMTKIPDLAYELAGDGVNLEQECGPGEVSRVWLHPLHVRLIASELGLLQGDTDAWRRVETLERRLQVLYGRIDRLDDMIRAAAEKGHEDLEVESTYSYATWELANEFCRELSATVGAAAGPANEDNPAPDVQRHGAAQVQAGLPLEVQQ